MSTASINGKPLAAHPQTRRRKADASMTPTIAQPKRVVPFHPYGESTDPYDPPLAQTVPANPPMTDRGLGNPGVMVGSPRVERSVLDD